MIATLKNYLHSLSHFIYPHHCNGCGSDVLTDEQLLCTKCIAQLPATNFASIEGNTVEKVFYGRLNIKAAAAAFYFSKESLLQHLIHQLKYKNNQDIGIYLGMLLGTQLLQSNRFNHIEIIVPLPLNAKREFKRGYNQAALIANGIASVLHKPVDITSVKRSINTQTQTHNSRLERWENMDGVFVIENKLALQNKHLLLVDDIITTGATLEACGKEILKANVQSLNIATIAYTA